jgi:hypothetical protein
VVFLAWRRMVATPSAVGSSFILLRKHIYKLKIKMSVELEVVRTLFFFTVSVGVVDLESGSGS